MSIPVDKVVELEGQLVEAFDSAHRFEKVLVIDNLNGVVEPDVLQCAEVALETLLPYIDWDKVEVTDEE